MLCQMQAIPSDKTLFYFLRFKQNVCPEENRGDVKGFCRARLSREGLSDTEKPLSHRRP